MNIFEIIKQNYDIHNEFDTIERLFFNIHSYAKCSRLDYNAQLNESVLEEIANMHFQEWKCRGSALNCEAFKEKVEKIQTKEGIEYIIIWLEYYINIIYFVKNFLRDDLRILIPSIFILIENIDILLDHISYYKVTNEDKGYIELIPVNAEVITCAEKTEDPHIAFAILKYNHYSLKGNIKDKQSLLLSISNKYEGFLTEGKKSDFKDYFNAVGSLLNNCNLRHNNKGEGTHNKELVKYPQILSQILQNQFQ